MAVVSPYLQVVRPRFAAVLRLDLRLRRRRGGSYRGMPGCARSRRLVAKARELAKLTRSVLEVVRRDPADTVPDATDLVVTRSGPEVRTALHHATCPVHIMR